jgi:hypothetical protein
MVDDATPSAPETIESTDVLARQAVSHVSMVEVLRIKASLWFAGAVLLIATATLLVSSIYNQRELQTWATGIISAITGAALGYGLNGRVGK